MSLSLQSKGKTLELGATSIVFISRCLIRNTKLVARCIVVFENRLTSLGSTVDVFALTGAIFYGVRSTDVSKAFPKSLAEELVLEADTVSETRGGARSRSCAPPSPSLCDRH